MLVASTAAYGPNLLSRLLAARTLQQIDDCAKSAWILNGEGLVDDCEMAYLAPVIEHQRRAIRAQPGFQTRSVGHIRPTTAKPAHRRPSMPEDRRAASWLRRRSLAKNCIIPTCIARTLTISKLAVLSVIAREVMDRGKSNMSLPEIAARAGVGCTTARYAIRDAFQMGLISVSENRINGFWSRPNTIRIVCGRWLRWLKEHAGFSARKKSGDGVVVDCCGTPLRNLIPTIEIISFSLRGAVHHRWGARANVPCWDGDTCVGRGVRALE
ncbi:MULTISPECIES: hypothetical protein [unclassified Shinella]|uniref:hypothetical protein n=1 Tax=unclassified Shinella TaxID=2643062 RepID=UPI00234E6DC3|nr:MULTISPECIES: hypothetical protein [unclassified Shinella]MCO5154069.1 hypothetical protein [Shinella sp.]MDC7266991.1 hypothetical protein [Shinella sp. HY16]MDC7273888.1 hypothetical protein [Shinella sp. YZ44]